MRRFLQRDPMLSLACLTIVVCLLKFLMEGIEIHVSGHNVTFGHADAATYAAILAPVLGAHGYVTTKTPPRPTTPNVDNPDAL